MKRRDFFKTAAAAGVGVAVPLSWSRADDVHNGPYLIVFNALGGWDTTYFCDPRGTPVNDSYNASQIQSTGNIRYAPTTLQAPLGVTNKQFFDRYGSETLVINGIEMATNNHQPGLRVMATGELDGLGHPSLEALVAAIRAPAAPLAFLGLTGHTSTGGLIAKTRVPYLSTLNQLADVDHVGGQTFQADEDRELIRKTLEGVANSGSTLPEVQSARSMLYASQVNSRTLSRVLPFVPPQNPDPLQAQADICLAAFASGLGVAGTVGMGNFDSHNSNDADQLRLLPQLLAGVDYTLRRAETLGIRDRLVVIIQSEMGRPPFYNSTRGKDHWSVTSLLALGPGIRGNRVVGMTGIDRGTGLDLTAKPVDPITLAVSDRGVIIRPAHIHQEMRRLFDATNHAHARRYRLKLPGGELPSLLTG